MKITWDEEAGAIYIYLVGDEDFMAIKTQEIFDGINVDYGMGEIPIGIEILNVDSEPFIERLKQ